MGRHPAAAFFPFVVKAVVEADDRQRKSVQVGRVVAYGIRLAVDGPGLCKLGFITEETEPWNHPEIAGFGDAVALADDFLPAALKDAPQVLGIGPGAGDFGLDLEPGSKPKSLGSWPAMSPCSIRSRMSTERMAAPSMRMVVYFI